MKKAIITLAILLQGVLGFSQSKNVVTERKYFLQDGLDKFVGTWCYQQNDEYFKIVLKKKEFKNNGRVVNFIEGYHIYKNKGILVDGLENDQINTINVGAFNPKNKDERTIEFRFVETKSQVRAKGTLSFEQENLNQLVFKVNLSEGGRTLKIDGKGNPYQLHIPNNVVLKRIK
jgi:hypothetical protein